MKDIIKTRKKTLAILFGAVILFAFSCLYSTHPRPVETEDRDAGLFRIWAHSDIQPVNESEFFHYETAVLDVAQNLPGLNAAIVAGDIVYAQKDADRYYRWFLETRKNAGIPYWFEIAGNHEARDLGAYLRAIGKPLHYAVSMGNMLIILMSDEKRTPQTEISQATFLWWRDLVMRNQDKIILTVSHAAPAKSGLPASMFPTMRLASSKRFEEVMKRYYVDLWISGHNHIASSISPKFSRPVAFPRTLFVEVASIHLTALSGIESYVLEFQEGSRECRVLTRDHQSRRFVASRSVNHTLRTGFRRGTGEPLILFPSGEKKAYFLTAVKG
ncbi:MAG TPA: metallophosphoesterase [Spirochaetota bacterium]|nr:metallophosphoesterase [Spirochaetota bacterium]